MSKLADKIRRATSVSPQPLGFGAAKASAEPSMVLAGIAKDASAAGELASAGADIVLIGSPKSAAAASGASQLKDGVTGAYIAGKQDNEATSYREGGFDFVVFDTNASATAVLDEKIGYVLMLPRDLDDTEIRTLEAFQLDAIDVGSIDGGLTVRRQIELRRLFAMTRKPLMATVSASISVTELQALRDTNVVVVAAEGAQHVQRLRQTIDALPPRQRRRDDERPTPLVPRTATAGEDDDDHEHD